MWARGPHCLSPTPTLSSDPQFHLVVQAGASKFLISVFLHISHFGTWYEELIHKYNGPTLGSTSSFKQELAVLLSYFSLAIMKHKYTFALLSYKPFFWLGIPAGVAWPFCERHMYVTYMQKTAFSLVKSRLAVGSPCWLFVGYHHRSHPLVKPFYRP